MPTVNAHLEKASSYVQNAADAVGAVIATGAITLPWWQAYLDQASVMAGKLVPILGGVWLLVQIIHRISHWSGKASDSED